MIQINDQQHSKAINSNSILRKDETVITDIAIDGGKHSTTLTNKQQQQQPLLVSAQSDDNNGNDYDSQNDDHHNHPPPLQQQQQQQKSRIDKDDDESVLLQQFIDYVVGSKVRYQDAVESFMSTRQSSVTFHHHHTKRNDDNDTVTVTVGTNDEDDDDEDVWRYEHTPDDEQKQQHQQREPTLLSLMQQQQLPQEREEESYKDWRMASSIFNDDNAGAAMFDYYHIHPPSPVRLLADDYANGKSKSYDDDVRIDYSVLSVGVMTLGLIMVVELFRHRLDSSANGRPFFKAVLEGVYTECKGFLSFLFVCCWLVIPRQLTIGSSLLTKLVLFSSLLNITFLTIILRYTYTM
jgi:hypothetical protein